MEAWTDIISLETGLEANLGKPEESTANHIAISFYDNEIPHFVARELERVYSSLFSTLSQFAFRKSGFDSTCTYVARRNNEIHHVLLFEHKGPIIQVLNEGISLSDEELARFAQAVFARYRKASIIRFHAIDVRLDRFPLPFQQHEVLRDIVLKLPDSPENYLAGLGKSTRSYLNRYQNKLRREFPSSRHEVLIGKEIDEHLISELIDMHKARMSSKEKISVIDDKRLQEIFRLTQEFGFAVVMRVDNRICAGTINYRVGNNYFLETVAHDPAYNEYRIGTLCSYLTVCECIARAGKEYHFLWGDYEYKFRLGGVTRELNDLFIYRSRLQIIFNSDFSIAMAFKRHLLQMKNKLQLEISQQNTLRSRLAGKTFHLLQKCKHKLMPCK